MKKRPHFLITNDDGISAAGIKSLWQAVKDIGDVTVVAPVGEQSAVSLSMTLRHPLRIERWEWQSEGTAWAVNGTPSDCVKLALNVILSTPPDLILSGINRGSNAGGNVLYSGTVAAVIEGTMQHVPGIAFSLYDYYKPCYTGLESHIQSIIRYVMQEGLPPGTFLNVNFPENASQGIKGIRLTRQGKEYWAENPEQRVHPSENSPYYWLGSRLVQFEEHEESDIRWLREGYATVVPIHIGELTDQIYIEQKRQIFEQLTDFQQPVSYSN